MVVVAVGYAQAVFEIIVDVQEGMSSNVSRLLATLRGVLPPARLGVLHGFCPGLGVMWRNSAKSKPRPGVAG
jgi:hypothetical protein